MAIPHMHVLIGYDGSECARAAVDDLARAGLPGDVEAVVLSVADVYPHLPAEMYQSRDDAAGAREQLSPTLKRCRELAALAMDDARRTADEGSRLVAGRFPSWRVRPLAVADSPYRAVVAEAGRWHADLVVVGSQGRSAAGRALLGSVSQLVLQHAPCSVRIARRPDDPSRLADDPPRFLVGIDGSPDAAAAISAVCDRTWPPGTQAQVVAAVDARASLAMVALGPPAGAWAFDPLDVTDDRAWARHAVGAAAEELGAAGVAVTPLVIGGDPKHVLLDAARQFNADCIFVGAKGHSRLERFLLGSVSTAVAARAHCSVEVVRQGE